MINKGSDNDFAMIGLWLVMFIKVYIINLVINDWIKMRRTVYVHSGSMGPSVKYY